MTEQLSQNQAPNPNYEAWERIAEEMDRLSKEAAARQQEVEEYNDISEPDVNSDTAPNPTPGTNNPTPDTNNAMPDINEAAPDSADEHPIDLEGFFVIKSDLSHDKKIAAHDWAERTVNDEVTNTKNFFKKLWKGTLAKKYYERKYTREILNGERTVADDEGNIKTLDELFRDNRTAALTRFRKGINEDLKNDSEKSAYIHDKFGESYKLDQAATDLARTAIKEFVKENQKDYEKHGDFTKLKANLTEKLGRHLAEFGDEGKVIDDALYNQYAAVAEQALQLSHHAEGIDDVIDGFNVYEAKIRDGARTEAHKNALEKSLDWLEAHTAISPVVLDAAAAASGACLAIVQGSARAGFGVAGLVAPTILSAAREHSRLTDERSRMLRDTESGMVYKYAGFTKQEIKSFGLKGAEKKHALHEAMIGGTLYQMESAKDLTAAIKNAENGDSLLEALAAARVRVDYSDSQKKGLIAYTAGKTGDERLALDIAMIEAEKRLSPEERENYETIKEYLSAEINKDVKGKDRKFAAERALAAAKKAGRTLAFGVGGFLVSQELLMAPIDPAKLGLLEKYGFIDTKNNIDAAETVLARGVGKVEHAFTGHNTNGDLTREFHRTFYDKRTIMDKNGENQATMDALEADGYTKVKVADAGWREGTTTTASDVAPADSIYNRTIKYDGWAKGGTNLQRVHFENGRFTSNITGNFTANGQTMNYDELSNIDAGRIKGYLTIGGAKMEVAATIDEAGHLYWGDGGVFNVVAPDGITTTPIQAIGENGEKLYKYFEIAVDNGVEDGVQHIIPLATDVGRNSFAGTINQIVTESDWIETPAVYDFVKTVSIDSARTFNRALDTKSIFSVAAINDLLASRTTIGAPNILKATEEATETTENTEGTTETAENAPEAAPEPLEATPASEAPNTPTPAVAAPESAPTAGEAVPVNGLAEFTGAYETQVENFRDLIGTEGVNNLLGTEPDTGINKARWSKWWNNLSNDGKNAVRTLISDLESSEYNHDISLGVGFRTWYHALAR